MYNLQYNLRPINIFRTNYSVVAKSGKPFIKTNSCIRLIFVERQKASFMRYLKIFI